MPYLELTKYKSMNLKGKALLWFLLYEAYTSRLCHRCKAEGKRLSQAGFKCPNCGLDRFNVGLIGLR